MKELIKIQENESLGQAVSARELYQFLEPTDRFSRWMERMLKYGFEENIDYIGCEVFHTLARQELDDYVLTIDTAKEIAMVQRSVKGREARRYFIQCERIAKSIQNGMGIQIRNGQATISTRSISSTTGIDHDKLIKEVKSYLDDHTEVFDNKRYPRKGHLRKGKFLIENIWELSVQDYRGIPFKEYILTRDGFNYLVKWHGFLALSGFLPHYSREFEILAHQEHIKALE